VRTDTMKGKPCPYEQITRQEGYYQDCQTYIDYSEGAEMTKANTNRGGDKNSGKGHTVKDCPIHFEVCYPSCYFWRGKCRYDQIISSAHEKGLCENRVL